MPQTDSTAITLDYYNNRHLGDAWETIGPKAGGAEEAERCLKDLREALREKDVLELGCGSGISTNRIVGVARSIVATEPTENRCREARERLRGCSSVRLSQTDAFRLEALPGKFNGGFASDVFAHIARSRYDEFFRSFHGRLEAGATVFLTGCQMSERWAKRVVWVEGSADAYCRRNLKDGSEYLIVDNFFSEKELLDLFRPRVLELRVTYGQFHWWMSYRTKGNDVA